MRRNETKILKYGLKYIVISLELIYIYKESDNVELKRKVTRVYVINYNVGQDLLKHLAKSEYESYIRAVASCPATCKETLNYIFERIVIDEYWPDTTIYVVCLDIAGNKSTDGMLLDRIFEPLEKINSLGTVERMLVYIERFPTTKALVVKL